MCVSFSICPVELPGWGVVACRVTASCEPFKEVTTRRRECAKNHASLCERSHCAYRSIRPIRSPTQQRGAPSDAHVVDEDGVVFVDELEFEEPNASVPS